ncbi:mediator of RNA polymerase II transcription subunit 20a isoform X3 [Pyrus x bretschneideri]|uniref:mediator of RNA polymerase II transcription subunit 20a isoform X3 n=1 Tax=Pyrus x bretschneideri TaxID=225117 RepID=UPI0005116EB6|nr:mediator of RNA polymerase II transcription subunit 20a isoform X3 [Pyrus x bretschneideri]
MGFALAAQRRDDGQQSDRKRSHAVRREHQWRQGRKLEYLPISSMEKVRQVMEEFMDIWQQALSKRSLLGHFMHVEPNFSEYGLDQCTSQHTAVQYAAIMAQLIAIVQAVQQSARN